MTQEVFFQVKEIIHSTSLIKDMDSLREIIDTYSGRVYNHALQLLKNKEDAEEATQDVFIRINKAIHLFRGDSKLSTWIWRITVNVCLTKLSKKKLHTDPLHDHEMTASQSETLFAEVENEERIAIIKDVLGKIPPQQASILTMFYIEEMSYKEIADVCNLPEGTVATLLYRGRENMRKELSDSYKDIS